jgi:hypothetical protein
MTEVQNLSARCGCGALELTIHGAPVVQLVCHCSDCQAFTAMPFSNIVFFKPDQCHVNGQATTSTFKGNSGFDKTHYACASCQTPVYVAVAVLNGAVAVIASQLLGFTFEPEAHIWTSEKADDVVIPAGALQSSRLPPKVLADSMVSAFWHEG